MACTNEESIYLQRHLLLQKIEYVCEQYTTSSVVGYNPKDNIAAKVAP